MRTDAGLSQTELAVASGLSRGTIQLIESGATITPRSERRLRAAFGQMPDAPDRLARVETRVAELAQRLDGLTLSRSA